MYLVLYTRYMRENTPATWSALRYRCATMLSSASCTTGTGVPARKACVYCGGRIVREQGVYGVFVWTTENRYPIRDAVRTFASQIRAQALCDSEAGRAANYVPRWIPMNERTV